MKHRKGVRRGAGVFVTGTDTGVGKTLVTAALALALKRFGTQRGRDEAHRDGHLPFQG